MSDETFGMMTNHTGATPLSEAAPNHFLGSTETPRSPEVSQCPLPGSPQHISPAFGLGGQIHRVTTRVSPCAMRLLTPIPNHHMSLTSQDGSHLPSCSRTTPVQDSRCPVRVPEHRPPWLPAAHFSWSVSCRLRGARGTGRGGPYRLPRDLARSYLPYGRYR